MNAKSQNYPDAHVREQGTTVWDFTAKSRIREYFPRLRAQMLPDGS